MLKGLCAGLCAGLYLRRPDAEEPTRDRRSTFYALLQPVLPSLPAHSWLDTLPLARALLPGRKGGHSLGALQAHLGFQLPPGQALHDAATDVGLLAQLLPHLLGASADGSSGSSGGKHGRNRGSAGSGSAGASGGINHVPQDFAQITVGTAASRCWSGNTRGAVLASCQRRCG